MDLLPDTTDADAPSPGRASEPLMTGPRYVLGPLLGRGGMGEVVSARDTAIGREVAIKTLRRPNKVAERRFLREARIQGRLDHPAIVPVYELGRDQRGQTYFAMKKINGTTLDKVQLPRNRLLRAFVDVCLAVELAHTRGVIHRDLKPTNIALGDFGEVYVLDWGVARLSGEVDRTYAGLVDADELTRDGTIVGTYGYMPPEQLCGELVDERADVYALGCVLFELLAGRPLHGRHRHPRDAGVDARPSRFAEVPPELEALCVAATAAKREDRIASARMLADAVQRYLDGDRDLALRGRLARDHLAAAKQLTDPALAMREAGKALAFDPSLDEAAELISAQLHAPGTSVAAATELARLEEAPTRQFTRNLLQIHAGGLVVFPLLWLLGIHDPAFLATALALSSVGVALAAAELRTGRALLPWHNAVIVALAVFLARAFTPFLVAPGVIGVNAIACAFHPGCTRPRTLIAFTAACVVGVLGVYGLEVVGAISRTVTWANGTLSLHSPLTGIEHLPAPAILCVYLAAVVSSGTVIAWNTARVKRVARERSHLEAWRLKQLIER